MVVHGGSHGIDDASIVKSICRRSDRGEIEMGFESEAPRGVLGRMLTRPIRGR
jgi:hypothetical protein